jgi:hypothetical protein
MCQISLTGSSPVAAKATELTDAAGDAFSSPNADISVSGLKSGREMLSGSAVSPEMTGRPPNRSFCTSRRGSLPAVISAFTGNSASAGSSGAGSGRPGVVSVPLRSPVTGVSDAVSGGRTVTCGSGGSRPAAFSCGGVSTGSGGGSPNCSRRFCSRGPVQSSSGHSSGWDVAAP